MNTANYEAADGGIIAKLDEGFVYTYADYTPLRIMPLGDSITHGVIGNEDIDSGGYRTFLERELKADRFAFDFVGSQTSEGSEINDGDHEGHPGWQIADIDSNVEQWLAEAMPDVVLLTIGTNDIFRHRFSSQAIAEELGELIDRITTNAPDTKLLVSSLPPIHPDERSAEQIAKGIAISQAIPELIEERKSEGKQVEFVDFGTLTADDLTSSLASGLDNGLHPHAGGYEKIASLWREAIYDETGNWDDLPDIKNVEGSIFADSLFGDEFDNRMVGNSGRDFLIGKDGNDVLSGGSGSDTLIGGYGVDFLQGGSEADLFVFQYVRRGIDIISDFTVASDKIVVSAKGFGGRLEELTELTAAQFNLGSTVSKRRDRFIYDSNNGNLFFDPDGTGSRDRVLFAKLSSNLAFSEQDLLLVA